MKPKRLISQLKVGAGEILTHWSDGYDADAIDRWLADEVLPVLKETAQHWEHPATNVYNEDECPACQRRDRLYALITAIEGQQGGT